MTMKVSLQTRDPKDALRRSRLFSYVGQQLASYGAACGMMFDEIRRLLTTHFSQLLAERKAQISKDGRLSRLDISALENGSAFAQDSIQSNGALLLGENDEELTLRFLEKYGVSLQLGTSAYDNVGTELKRAYRDYCSSVLDYDRSLDIYQFENQTDAALSVQNVEGSGAEAEQVSIQREIIVRDASQGCSRRNPIPPFLHRLMGLRLSRL